MLMGDLNVDLLKTSSKTDRLFTITESFPLEQLIDKPTRVTESTTTLLDQIYVSCPESILLSKALPVTFSDHYAVLAIYGARTAGHLQNPIISLFSIETWRISACHTFCLTWQRHHGMRWICMMTLMMYWPYGTNCMRLLDRHAPVRRKRVKNRHQPKWLIRNTSLTLCIWETNYTALNLEDTKNSQDLVKTTITTAKKKFYNDQITNNYGNSGTPVAMYQRIARHATKAHKSPQY